MSTVKINQAVFRAFRLSYDEVIVLDNINIITFNLMFIPFTLESGKTGN